jgi:hypothetical protein
MDACYNVLCVLVTRVFISLLEHRLFSWGMKSMVASKPAGYLLMELSKDQGEDNIAPRTWKGRTKKNKRLKNTKCKSGIRDRTKTAAMAATRQSGNKGTSHKTATAS